MNWNEPLEIWVKDETALPTQGWVDVVRYEETGADYLLQIHKCYYLYEGEEAYWWFDKNGEARMMGGEEPFALVRNK